MKKLTVPILIIWLFSVSFFISAFDALFQGVIQMFFVNLSISFGLGYWGYYKFNNPNSSSNIVRTSNVTNKIDHFTSKPVVTNISYKTPEVVTVQKDYTKKRSFVDSYTVLDFETTGLDPVNDEIIEVGAVKFLNGQAVEQFGTLVKPKKPISSRITKINGISNSMVSKSPSIETVVPELIKFIGDDVIVAHNASFDMKFLINVISRLKLNHHVSNAVADTLQLSRKHFPELENHKLPTLKNAIGMKNTPSHRSVDDCIVTGAVYWHCKLRNEKK